MIDNLQRMVGNRLDPKMDFCYCREIIVMDVRYLLGFRDIVQIDSQQFQTDS
jgi:hypothetical protein